MDYIVKIIGDLNETMTVSHSDDEVGQEFILKIKKKLKISPNSRGLLSYKNTPIPLYVEFHELGIQLDDPIVYQYGDKKDYFLGLLRHNCLIGQNQGEQVNNLHLDRGESEIIKKIGDNFGFLPEIYKYQWNRRGFSIKDQSISSLNLINSKMTLLPPEIENITKLEILDLRYNNLFTFSSWNYKKNIIRILFLCHNDFPEIPPIIEIFQNIEELTLAENQIMEIPPFLKKFPKLHSLNLSSNPLDCHAIRNMIPPLLQYLNLSYCNLPNFENVFEKKSNLNHLNLSHNKLTQFEISFSNIQEIRQLVIHSNLFSSFPDEIFSLKNLEFLNISNNFIDIIPNGILELQKLKWLKIDSRDYPNETLETIDKLKKKGVKIHIHNKYLV